MAHCSLNKLLHRLWQVGCRPDQQPRLSGRSWHTEQWALKFLLAPGARGTGRMAPRPEFSGELLQGRDAVFSRGVRGKEVIEAVARQRIDDEHVRGRRIALGFHVGNLVRGVVDL